MGPTSLLLLSLLVPCLPHPTSWQGVEHNHGWAAYLADEPSEFHSLPLSWELDRGLPG